MCLWSKCLLLGWSWDLAAGVGSSGDQGGQVQHSPVASGWCWFEQSPPPAMRRKVLVCQKAFFKPRGYARG